MLPALNTSGADGLPKSVPPALADQEGRVEPGVCMAAAHQRHARPGEIHMYQYTIYLTIILTNLTILTILTGGTTWRERERERDFVSKSALGAWRGSL